MASINNTISNESNIEFELSWKKIDDYGCINIKTNDYRYINMKINAIYNNRNKSQSQLIEIQFLLNFVLDAKKLGHKYYTIKRTDGQATAVGKVQIVFDQKN